MATSTLVFVALHGETIFWPWQSKNSMPVALQSGSAAQPFSPGPDPEQNPYHVVANKLDTDGKATCLLLFSILVLLCSSSGSTFRLA